MLRYAEFSPTILLYRRFIYCYWELKTTAPLDEPFICHVVADGCIDIYFEAPHGKPSANWVMGFSKQYTEFQLDNQFHYVECALPSYHVPAIIPRGCVCIEQSL